MPAGKIYRVPPSRGLTKRQSNQVRTIINKDKDYKAFYAQTHLTAVTTGKHLYDITELSEDVGSEFQRSSDKIHLVKAVVQFSMKQNITVAADQLVRLMILRAKKRPLVTADCPTIDGIPDTQLYSVMYDEVFNLPTTDFDTIQRTKKIKIKKKKIPYWTLTFDDDVDKAGKNSIYVYMVGSEVANGADVVFSRTIGWFDCD